MNFIGYAAVAAVAVVAIGAAVADNNLRSNTVRVLDGDTIELGGKRIRLYGIDAPESRQTCRMSGRDYSCGRVAAAELERLVQGSAVTCKGSGKDGYGRVIAVCRAGGVDLNEAMAAGGWAVAYARYSTQYLLAEDAARKQKLGMWAGEFAMPWDWRRQNK